MLKPQPNKRRYLMYDDELCLQTNMARSQRFEKPGKSWQIAPQLEQKDAMNLSVSVMGTGRVVNE